MQAQLSKRKEGPFPTNWGIAGCGKISSDFVTALQHEGSSQHVVLAVAARSKTRADAFRDKFAAKRSYDCYADLGKDREIDVVYVGTITSTHFEIVKGLLLARKAVLCEKPLCVTSEQTQELVDLAKEQDTFLMEAMWSRFTPVHLELKRRLENDEIGELSHVLVTFGQEMRHIERLNKKELGGGSVLDIGIYAINLILWTIGDMMPKYVTGVGGVNDEGVENEVSACLAFSGGMFGTFVLSTNSVLPNEAVITGTKGTIKLKEPFWCPEAMTSPSGEFVAPLDPSDKKYNFTNSQGLKYQARAVARCLNKALTECPLMPLSQTILMARIMQEVQEVVLSGPK